MGDIPPVRHCGLYLPGHDVHWIQVFQSQRDTNNAPVAGRLAEIRDDGVVVVEVDGERLDLWNHDPERLRIVVEENGPDVSYQQKLRLLRSPGLRHGCCFDVALALDSHRRPCPTEPPTGSLFERLQAAGGFTVPASELLDAPDVPPDR